jgi:hypothetical protein
MLRRRFELGIAPAVRVPFTRLSPATPWSSSDESRKRERASLEPLHTANSERVTARGVDPESPFDRLCSSAVAFTRSSVEPVQIRAEASSLRLSPRPSPARCAPQSRSHPEHGASVDVAECVRRELGKLLRRSIVAPPSALLLLEPRAATLDRPVPGFS